MSSFLDLGDVAETLPCSRQHSPSTDFLDAEATILLTTTWVDMLGGPLEILQEKAFGT